MPKPSSSMQALAHSVQTILAATSPAIRSCSSRRVRGLRSTGTRKSGSTFLGIQLRRKARLLSVEGIPRSFTVMATSRLSCPSFSARARTLFSRAAPMPKL